MCQKIYNVFVIEIATGVISHLLAFTCAGQHMPNSQVGYVSFPTLQCLYGCGVYIVLGFSRQPWVVNILSCCSPKYNHGCQAMCHEFGFENMDAVCPSGLFFLAQCLTLLLYQTSTPSPLPILIKGLFLFQSTCSLCLVSRGQGEE